MDTDGISLAIGGGAVGAIATIAGAWIKAKFSATNRSLEGPHSPSPIDVRLRDEFADRRANDSDHEALFLRMSAVEQKTAHTEGVLEQIDKKLDTITTYIINSTSKPRE